MDWHTHLKKIKQQIDSTQDPHPYFSAGLTLVLFQSREPWRKLLPCSSPGGELSSTQLNEGNFSL